MKNEEKDFINIGEASKLTGIGKQTLRRMVERKEISCYQTLSKHRKFNREYLLTMSGKHIKTEVGQKVNMLYTRVSTKKQLDDLHRQIEFIKRPEYSSYTIIQDIGSGINFKRKGIQTILDHCIQGTIGEIVVAHKDRLSRFGFDLIESIVSKAGGKITILDKETDSVPKEQELSEDILSIIHIFNCRQMGRRKYKKPSEIQNIKCEA